MSEIYLIRHGQASFGAADYDRLSEKGVTQAAVLGEHLANLDVEFDAVCCGEMDRQQKTAQGMMVAYRQKGLYVPTPEVMKSFNEYDAESVWKSQVAKMREDAPEFLDPIEKDPNNNTTFQKVFSKVVKRWVSGKFDAPGDFTWNAFKSRVSEGLFALMVKQGPSKRIAVFSSGGPISVAVQAVLDLDDIKTVDVSWQVMNASITRIVYSRGRIGLAGFNDITHLALTGDKSLLTYR
jgi:broad specificity phosphatase PhoE